jgi:HEAT repeat protein
VAIKASASKAIDSLLADLTGSSDVRREAAIARLTVIGARAVDRLVSLAASSADAPERGAALRALEGIGDHRALDVALAATGDEHPAIALAAIALARAFIHQEKGAAIVDRLTAAAIDRSRPERVRLAAVQALKDLDPATVAPLMRSLAGDPSRLVRAEAKSASITIEQVAEDGLPEDAATLRDLLSRAGRVAPLPALLRVIERVREREAVVTPGARAAWAMSRALAHLALARRQSRLALYDLRESLERATEPLPVDALAALALVGDASCLEPIAASYARSKDAWWRDRLGDTFRTIVDRERVTRRHAVVKRIEKRWKKDLDTLWNLRM